MKTWIGAFSVASALFFAFACGDDDSNSSGNTGGAGGASGGEAGNAAETGGSHTGGVATGGTDAGGTDAGGTDAGGTDAGGAGGAPPLTCNLPVSAGGASDGAGGAGGAAASAGGAGGALAIEGSYVGEFMEHYTVTSSDWSNAGALYHIARFDNAEHWIVALNDQANMYNPCAWSRFDWTYADGALYYCTTAYDAESEAAALATRAADASNPASWGCGGFAWSKLTPE